MYMHTYLKITRRNGKTKYGYSLAGDGKDTLQTEREKHKSCVHERREKSDPVFLCHFYGRERVYLVPGKF